MSKRLKVVFALDAIAHYRESFFCALKERLSADAIDLHLVIGASYKGHNIQGNITWATTVPLHSVGPFSWLEASKITKDADLLIVAQVLKQTFLFHAITRHLLRRQKIGMFGHGKLYSERPASHLSNILKRYISKQCHWWFAYTEKSLDVVRDEIRFPRERITVVNNSVDTLALSTAKDALTFDQIQAVRSELNIKSDNIGIFVGGMYHGTYHSKRLDYLLDCCFEIRRYVSDFEMIFVGGGPDQSVVEKAAANYPWIHYVGIKKGVEAVPYWALSKVCLNPGLVGLGILDSFALGVPLITTNVPFHSPEIVYLKNTINGLIIEESLNLQAFAYAAANLITDEHYRQKLVTGCEASAKMYTNEAMVEKFYQGIVAALSKPLSF